MLHGITDSDLVGKGIKDLPDIPGLSADEMKRKFEEIVRDVVITKFNEAVEEINSQFFVTPEGISYVTQGNIVASYDAVLAAKDPTKIPACVAIDEMNTSINSKFTNVNTSINSVSRDLSDLSDTVDEDDEILRTLNSKVNKNFVVFRPTGGTCLLNQTEFTGGVISLGTATREGYTFKGWATKENGPVVYQAYGQLSTFTANFSTNIMEIFAVWEANA